MRHARPAGRPLSVSTTRRRTSPRQNIATGFAYLWREAGFVISQSSIAYQPADTYARALLVGILNTVRVSASPWFSRRSSDVGGHRPPVVAIRCCRDLMMVYVEILRNVPLLLLLFLCYAVIVSRRCRPCAKRCRSCPQFYLSNSGLMVPSSNGLDELSWITLALVLGAIAASSWRRRCARERVANGSSAGSGPSSHSHLFGPAVLLALVLRPTLSVDFPEIGRFRISGRRAAHAGIRRASGGADPGRLGQCRRDRAQRHHRHQERAMGGGLVARPAPVAGAAPRDPAAILTRHHPADDEHLSQHLQEFVAGHCHRLSGSRHGIATPP